MSENIHNDDDALFRKAYNHFEEKPSQEVWEKLNARLNQQDAVVYRAKFTLWKRIAVVLIFLLGSAMAYEIFVKPATTTSVTAEKKHEKPVQANTSQLPSLSNQPQNKVTDSLNEVTINTLPTSKQNSKQDSPQTDEKNSPEVFNKQATATHVLPNHINNVVELAKENNLSAKKNQQSITPESAVVAQTPNDQQQPLSVPLNNADIAAEKENKLGKEDIASQNNTAPVTLDSLTNKATNNSALAANSSKDSSAGTLASNKKSPVKIKNLFKPHVSFSPYIAADFTGHKIDNDDHHREPGGRDERGEIEGHENNQFSFSTGVLARYQFSKKLSVKSGLVYSNTAIHSNPETLYATQDNNRGTGYKYISSLGYAYVKPPFDQSPAIGDSIHCENAEQHASYLSIPLMASYTINAGKRFSILPGIGFTTNLLLGSTTQTEIQKDNEQSKILIKNMQGLAPVYFSFVADAELHYQLSHDFSLMLLPSFKHAIVPTTANHVVKTYPYNFGLGIGVTYGL